MSFNLDNNLNKVIQDDCIAGMKRLPDNSINMIFTSPPYLNARSYAQYESYEAYMDFLIETFVEAHRVLKAGHYLIVNTSNVIVSRKGRNYESERYTIPFDLNYHLLRNGYKFIDDIIWQKPEASVFNRVANFNMHRKPMIYKPNMTVEYLMVYRKMDKENPINNSLDRIIKVKDKEIVKQSLVHGKIERNNVWYINPETNKVHSAVFPKKLCDLVISYYSFVNDWVLDPFAGSGTLGASAIGLNRKFILIEREAEYVEYMFSRKEFATNPNIELIK